MSIDHFDPPLTIGEAAQERTAPSTIYKLLKSKQLSAVKFGGARRIPTSSVERYYASAPVAEYAPLTAKEGANTVSEVRS